MDLDLNLEWIAGSVVGEIVCAVAYLEGDFDRTAALIDVRDRIVTKLNAMGEVEYA